MACVGLVASLGCGGAGTQSTASQEKAAESGNVRPAGLPEMDMKKMYQGGGGTEDMSKMKQDMNKAYPGYPGGGGSGAQSEGGHSNQ